jgi:hypothetical protein
MAPNCQKACADTAFETGCCCPYRLCFIRNVGNGRKGPSALGVLGHQFCVVDGFCPLEVLRRQREELLCQGDGSGHGETEKGDLECHIFLFEKSIFKEALSIKDFILSYLSLINGVDYRSDRRRMRICLQIGATLQSDDRSEPHAALVFLIILLQQHPSRACTL